MEGVQVEREQADAERGHVNTVFAVAAACGALALSPLAWADLAGKLQQNDTEYRLMLTLKYLPRFSSVFLQPMQN